MYTVLHSLGNVCTFSIIVSGRSLSLAHTHARFNLSINTEARSLAIKWWGNYFFHKHRQSIHFTWLQKREREREREREKRALSFSSSQWAHCYLIIEYESSLLCTIDQMHLNVSLVCASSVNPVNVDQVTLHATVVILDKNRQTVSCSIASHRFSLSEHDWHLLIVYG